MKKIKAFLTFCIVLLFGHCFVNSQGIQIRKVAYNPHARDWSGLGYEGIPPFTGYVPPLDPAPGLVQVGPNLSPNFQISDEDFSGTCVPGDTIILVLEVYNGAGVPVSVQVQDDISQGMINAQVPHTPPPPLIPLPPGSVAAIQDTNGDFIIGNAGDTVIWNIPAIPPGYTLLTYQADVLSDGSVNFGDSITNDNAIVYYYELGMQRTQTAPSITILVQHFLLPIHFGWQVMMHTALMFWALQK